MEENVTYQRTLTLFQVVALGLAWMSPMIYFTVYGIAYEGSRGWMTSSYSVAAAAILLTAFSYMIMSKRFTSSASAYSYVKKAIHPYAGFLVGWVVMLEYIFSPVIACLTFGLYMHAQFPGVPASVWIIGINLIFAVVNIVGIKFSAGISKIFVVVQILFIAVFSIFLLKGLAGSAAAIAVQPILPQGEWGISAILTGASIVCFSFLGFDTVTTLADETINAQKTIPRAIMLIVLIAAVMYIGVSVLTKLVFPSLAFTNGDAAGFELMRLVGGAGLQSLFISVLIMAVFTQGVIAVTSASRLLHVMGTDSTLPRRFFGKLHLKYKTPINSIVVVCVISMLALVLSLETAIKFVSLGALTAFVFVNGSVVAQMYVKEKRRSFKQTIIYLIVPLIGACFVGWLLTLLDRTALLMGACWLIIGVLYHLYRTKPMLAAVMQKRQMD